MEGGAAVTLCDASFGLGGSWGDDGNIIAALQFSTGTLFRVPSIGGTPVAVTKMNPGEITHRFPQVLPGSQAVLFTVASEVSRSAFDSASLDLLMLKTGERKTILKEGFFPRYVAGTSGSNGTGHIVYVHQATLFAVPFDLDRLSTNGSSVPILEDVDSSSSGGGDITFAQNGTVAYHPGRASIGGSVISWVDSSAKTSPLHAPPGEYTTLRFSPDGKRLAFSITSGDASDIWVKELDRDSPSRLSFLPGRNDNPVWTPDGRHIVFRSTNPAASGLYGIRSDGSSEAKRLTEGKQGESPGSFSPDGKRLAIVQTGDGSQADIFTMPAETDSGIGTFGLRLGKAELFLGTPFRETNPRFSPDGRWLAYISNESGKSEVYVRPFPGPGGKWQISTGPGSAPRWSRDGRELLYLGQRGDVMAVSYTAQNGAFAAGKPRVWSEARLSLLSATYDIAPDGKRLAAIALGQSEVGRLPRPQLTFLLNFIDELRRKAPAGK